MSSPTFLSTFGSTLFVITCTVAGVELSLHFIFVSQVGGFSFIFCQCECVCGTYGRAHSPIASPIPLHCVCVCVCPECCNRTDTAV